MSGTSPLTEKIIQACLDGKPELLGQLVETTFHELDAKQQNLVLYNLAGMALAGKLALQGFNRREIVDAGIKQGWLPKDYKWEKY